MPSTQGRAGIWVDSGSLIHPARYIDHPLVGRAIRSDPTLDDLDALEVEAPVPG